MRKFSLTLFALFLVSVCSAQGDYPNYQLFQAYNRSADSLYKIQNYKLSAELYTKIFSISIEKAVPISYINLHYNASCSWALALVPDSAFHHLKLAAELGYSNKEHILTDPDLDTLRTDPRWENIMTIVISNQIKAENQKRHFFERTTMTQATDEILFNPPSEYVRKFIFNDSLPFISINYDIFRMYFRGNSYVAMHLEEIKKLLREAMKRINFLLNEKPYHRGINLVLVDSKAELKELTGMGVGGGFAVPGYDAVFLVYTSNRRFQAKHELFHLVGNAVWGITRSRLLNEGSAVFSDNECYCKDPIYKINSAIIQKGLLIPFEDLVDDFDRIANTNEVIAYLEAAGIVKYLYEKKGVEKLRKLWLSGFKEFENIYGCSIKKFEEEWKLFISTIKVPKELNWDKFFNEGCG